MTTDDFATAARDLGLDPEEVRASVGNALAHRLRVGMSDEEVLMWLWHAGAIYGRDHLAAQEPSDAEVEAAARHMALCDRIDFDDLVRRGHGLAGQYRRQACAALSAARNAGRAEG